MESRERKRAKDARQGKMHALLALAIIDDLPEAFIRAALAIFSQISTVILCLPSSFLVRSDRFREIEKLNTALFFFFFFF